MRNGVIKGHVRNKEIQFSLYHFHEQLLVNYITFWNIVEVESVALKTDAQNDTVVHSSFEKV